MDGVQKDPKRSLTDAEKSELLEACRFQCQGGSCSDRDLRNKRFEFHHVKPHSLGGLTTRYQHLVLCVDCHAKLHGRKRKGIALDQEFGPVWDDLREWQRQALQRFQDSLIDQLHNEQTLRQQLRYYVANLPFYQRVAANGLATSIELAARDSGLLQQTAQHWLQSAPAKTRLLPPPVDIP